MSVVLYLILATVMLVVSIATAGIAAGEAAALRQRDQMMEFKNERQHALLGRVIEWSARIVSGGWTLIALSHFMIFSFAVVVDPLRAGWEQRPLPALFAAIGLTASVGVLVAVRISLRKARQVIRQYDDIVAGKDPDWAFSGEPRPHLSA